MATPLSEDVPSAERRFNLSDAPSPAWLKGLIENATKGRPRDFIDFLDLMRERDGRIDSCAQRLEGAVSSLDWSVIAPDVDEGLQDRAAEIASDAERMLRRIEYVPGTGSDVGQGGFEDLLLGLASMYYYGWTNPESQWDYVESVKRWEPIRYAFRHSRRLSWYEVDHRPRLYDPGAKGPAGQWPGMDLDPLRWLVCRGKVRPSYPARDGLGRTAAWLYAFKRFSWKDFIQFSEQFGTPFILGLAGGGTATAEHIIDDDTATVLKEVVRNLRSRSRGVIDGRDKIEVLWPQVSGKSVVPAEIIVMCDEEIAILFQGATQSVAVGDKGTYASAETHKGVERDKVERYARTLSNGITFGILRGWFSINYPEAAQGFDLCPAFWLNSSQPANLEASMAIDRGLYDLGFPLLKSDISDRYNRPMPEEDVEEDDLLKRSAAPTGLPFDSRPASPVALASTTIPPKAQKVDEDKDNAGLEGSAAEYAKVAQKAAAKARGEAIDKAVDGIDSFSDKVTPEEFADRLAKQLGPEYAKVMATGKFKPIVEAIYERFKLDTSGWPQGLSFDFSSTDLLLQEQLAKLDTTYWSKYITGPGSDASVKGFLKDWYGEKGGDLYGRMKPETIADFKAKLGGKLEQIHDWQAQRIINSGVVRVRGYAQIRQMHDAFVDTMELYATSGEQKICAVCRQLHGTRVSVARVYDHMIAESSLAPEAWIKVIKTRGSIAPEAVSSEEACRALFEETGLQLPVHPLCACRWRFVYVP